MRILSIVLILFVLCDSTFARNNKFESRGCYLYSSPFYQYINNYDSLIDQFEKLGIKSVLLSTDANLLDNVSSNYRKYVRDFIKIAHQRGVFVHAMHLQSYHFIDGYAGAIDRTNKIIDYNNNVEDLEKFDGVHLDVEPHTHPNWTSPNGYLPGSNANETIMRNFIGLLDTLRSVLDLSLSNGADTLIISADQTYWIHDKAVAGELNTGHVNDLLKYIDFITLFDYTDNESNLITHVDDEIYAANRPKSIVLAMDTKYDLEYPSITFYDEGYFAYDRGDKILHQYFGKEPSFLGTCVFKYESTQYLYDNRYSNGLITSVEEDLFEFDEPKNSSSGEWTINGSSITGAGIIDSIQTAFNGTKSFSTTVDWKAPSENVIIRYQLGTAYQNGIQNWSNTPIVYFYLKAQLQTSAKIFFGVIEEDGDHWRLKNPVTFSTHYEKNSVNLFEENLVLIDNAGGGGFSLEKIKFIEFYIEADPNLGENIYYFDDILVGEVIETYPDNVITSIELDKFSNTGPSSSTPGEWTRYGTILTSAGITLESQFVHSGKQAIFYGADWNNGTFGGLRYQLGAPGQKLIQDWSHSTELYFYGKTNLQNNAQIEFEIIEEDGDRWRMKNAFNLTTNYEQYTVNLAESNFNVVESNGNGVYDLTKVKFISFTFRKGSDTGKYKYYFDDFTRNKITRVNQENSLPDNFKLIQNYPNPFNPKTVINYIVNKNTNVKLTIYDLLGNTVDILVDKLQGKGNYQIEYNASNLSSGIYFCEMRVDNNSQRLKMMLLK